MTTLSFSRCLLYKQLYKASKADNCALTRFRRRWRILYWTVREVCTARSILYFQELVRARHISVRFRQYLSICSEWRLPEFLVHEGTFFSDFPDDDQTFPHISDVSPYTFSSKQSLSNNKWNFWGKRLVTCPKSNFNKETFDVVSFYIWSKPAIFTRKDISWKTIH